MIVSTSCDSRAAPEIDSPLLGHHETQKGAARLMGSLLPYCYCGAVAFVRWDLEGSDTPLMRKELDRFAMIRLFEVSLDRTSQGRQQRENGEYA